MTALWTALIAGVVAAGVTRAVERWGGVVGGLVGTLPSTIVPAGFGLWAANPAGFADALGVIPAGMLLNAGFLWLWRVIPARLPSGSLGRRLLWMTALSLSAWALAAVGLGLLTTGLKGYGVWTPWIGLAGWTVGLAWGVAACWARVPAPRGARSVRGEVLVARGLLAGGAVGVAVVLAGLGVPVLSGLATVFPSIFLTTMVSLWWAQGEGVPAGAVGPMMLGASSIGAYALLAIWAFPVLGPAWGTLFAWVGAAGGVSLPAALWLRHRRA